MRLAAQLDLMGKGRGHGVANAGAAIFLLRWRHAARGLVHPGCVVSETSDRGEKAPPNLPIIRIHSDRKWPERVVYDTSRPTIVPASIASAEVIVPAPEAIGGAPASTRVREIFAMVSADQPQAAKAKVREPKPVRQSKLARRRAPAPRYAMARHPQFGWSGENFWW
jgi:hypothetical protein